MAKPAALSELDWGCDATRPSCSSLFVSRRCFLKNGALALVGTSAIPTFLQRSVLAEMTTAASSRKKLVVLFQRGAADGLNIVVPFAEPHYYQMRPTLAIPQKQVLDLDGFFGLHPAMSSLMPFYREGSLAIVHAAGSPDMTRSHFDAQDYMESGTPGVRTTPDGWLNRALQAESTRSAASPFRAVALGGQLPRTLQGAVPAVAMHNVEQFGVMAPSGRATSSIANTFASMYDASSNSLLHGTSQEAFEAVRMLKAAKPEHYQPAFGVTYPKGTFGSNLRQIAQLIKADLGVEAAFADIGGWDTHQNQGAVEGQLANRLHEFSDGIAAFWRDMGAQAADVTLVTMSEFGRTARENGTGGTDHGHANVMFVLGGSVRGGRVYGRWPGLAQEQLNEGRDLAVATDFRRVLAEATARTLGCQHVQAVFPDAPVSPDQFLGLFRT